jgi:hypothetical protein
MPRLIDADALLAYIDVGHLRPPTEICFSELDVKNIVDKSPTLDAVPVVRGEWVEAKSGVMSVYPPGQVMCSVCKQRMPSQWKKMPPYCYGCGAKMEDKPCG